MLYPNLLRREKLNIFLVFSTPPPPSTPLGPQSTVGPTTYVVFVCPMQPEPDQSVLARNTDENVENSLSATLRQLQIAFYVDY
jgi:hypothetical protein